MTGTFKFETKTGTYVFRDESGNSVSWDQNSIYGWQVWAKGGKLEADCATLTEALECLERRSVGFLRVVPEHQNSYDRREREAARFEDRNGRVEGVDP